MPAFSPEAVRAIATADLSARLAAAERAASVPFPTPDEEVWRYSRIDELDLEQFTPGRATTTVDAPAGVLAVAGAELGDRFDAGDAIDLFHELNTAFMDAVVVSIPAGKHIADPIVITHTLTAEGVACFPRLVIDAGADSECTVVEQFISDDGLRAM